MKELTYEEEIARRKELAQLVWSKPFMCGLSKFKKSDLLILVRLLTERLSAELEPIYYELDLKDACFNDKCNIIETLDEDFFKRDKE